MGGGTGGMTEASPARLVGATCRSVPGTLYALASTTQKLASVGA